MINRFSVQKPILTAENLGHVVCTVIVLVFMTFNIWLISQMGLSHWWQGLMDIWYDWMRATHCQGCLW